MSTTINNREFLKALALAVVSLAISAIVLLTAYLLSVPILHPEFRPYIENDSAVSISIPGNSFHPVVFGDGGFEGQAAVISQLAELPPEDHAVLVHKRRFQSGQFPFLRYDIEGRSPALRVMLFWQRADAPGENFFMELDDSGERAGIQNLQRSEDWKGQITELGVGFFGELREGSVKLHEVKLEPYSTGQLMEVVWGEWTTRRVWDQTSINVYRGVSKGTLLYPVPSVALWVSLAAALILLTRPGSGNGHRRFNSALCALLIGWLLLDGLWLRQRFLQNLETVYLFAGKTLHEKKLADWDGEYYAAIHSIKDALDSSTEELIVLYQGNQDALAQRMRFHLLPELKASTLRPISRGWLQGADRKFDHVIVISAPGTTIDSQGSLQEPLTSKLPGDWRLIWTQGSVALYATNRVQKEGSA